MSMGFTGSTPSVYDRPCTPEIMPVEWIPSFLAISAVSLTPTSRMSWANTVFTDLVVATRRFMAGPPSPSAALWIWQLDAFLVSRHPGMVNMLGAEYVFAGVYPLANAAASVNGLNDDPAWRPPPPPVMVPPSQQVAGTMIFFGSLGRWSEHPPRAKLVDSYFPDP